MALPSPFAYGSRPDYASGVGRALGGAAKTAHDLSPAHPLLAQALRRIYGGEDPRAVAIETKFAMSRQGPQPQPPALPEPAAAPALSGSMRSSMPPRLVGRVEDTTNAPALPDLPAQPGGEYEEEIVVQAPPPPPPEPRGSMPLMSEASTDRAFYSQAQPPILNRDLPVLMQGAELAMKEDKNDLGYLNYLLGRERLDTNRDQFGRMEVHRGIRDEATKANTAEIPERRRLAQERLGVSKFNAQTGRMGVETRRGENYMKGAGNLTWAVPAMDQLLQRFQSDPELVPGGSDYLMRRGAEIASTFQGNKYGVSGRTAGMTLERVADAMLTPAQRDTRRQVRLIVQTMIVHPEFGATLTPQEIALANELTGEQLSPRDTAAGLAAFRSMTAAKWQRYINLYPDVARKVGSPTGSNWGGPLPEPGNEGLEYLEPSPGVR